MLLSNLWPSDEVQPTQRAISSNLYVNTCSVRRRECGRAYVRGMIMEERILFYAGSFFKIDGVTLTLRGLISHTVKRGACVCVLTADDPTDEAIDAFVQLHPVGAVSVLRATGGLVPAPGSDYYMGLHVGKGTKEAIQDYNPSVVHMTNPDLVALWVSEATGFRFN